MYHITTDMTDEEVKKYEILNRIEKLEMQNDLYMENTGMMNPGIYNKIQELYDKLEAMK